jgi:hypothetical protein|tara:strand:+ start:145 stop:300 length:156 start_codon:yes stop_codon:yes gene_type:complete
MHDKKMRQREKSYLRKREQERAERGDSRERDRERDREAQGGHRDGYDEYEY